MMAPEQRRISRPVAPRVTSDRHSASWECTDTFLAFRASARDRFKKIHHHPQATDNPSGAGKCCYLGCLRVGPFPQSLNTAWAFGIYARLSNSIGNGSHRVRVGHRRPQTSSNVWFHDLRHEAVSRFFEKGLSMHEVAAITGHRDARTSGNKKNISGHHPRRTI